MREKFKGFTLAEGKRMRATEAAISWDEHEAEGNAQIDSLEDGPEKDSARKLMKGAISQGRATSPDTGRVRTIGGMTRPAILQKKFTPKQRALAAARSRKDLNWSPHIRSGIDEDIADPDFDRDVDYSQTPEVKDVKRMVSRRGGKPLRFRKREDGTIFHDEKGPNEPMAPGREVAGIKSWGPGPLRPPK